MNALLQTVITRGSRIRAGSRIVTGSRIPARSRHHTRNFAVASGARCSYTTSLDTVKRRLVVDSLPAEREEFPWVWLRDNCQCPQCYESLAQSRIVNLAEFNINVKPVSVKNDGSKIEILWEDGHLSEYNYSWLLHRSFSEEKRSRRREILTRKSTMWGKDFQSKFPTADYHSIMTDDSALLGWLEELDEFGFVLVRNVPVREGPVPDLQKRVAFERLTHYGPGYTVKVRPDPSNLSYTHHRIFFHTDLTYYEHMPGSIFLHCIEQHQGKGGETMLADGFLAAKLLKEKYPEKYKLLSNTITYFKDIGVDFTKYNKMNQAPVLVHDFRGELKRINWSHFARDSFFDVDLDEVEDVYDAMRTFDDILNNKDNHIRLKMEPGDMVTVKNQRILHGRSELEGGVSGRYLQCGYMDWDEIESTVRVLRNQTKQ